MLEQSRLARIVTGMLVGCALLNCHCGPGPGGNGNSNTNGNGNGNANDNAGGGNDNGTGHTVDDLPDLSSDDVLGMGEGPDVFVPELVLVGYDQTLTVELLTQLAESTANVVNGELLDLLTDIHVATIRVEAGTEDEAIAIAQQLDNVDYAELNFAGRLAGGAAPVAPLVSRPGPRAQQQSQEGYAARFRAEFLQRGTRAGRSGFSGGPHPTVRSTRAPNAAAPSSAGPAAGDRGQGTRAARLHANTTPATNHSPATRSRGADEVRVRDAAHGQRRPSRVTELLPEAASVEFSQYHLFTINAIAARAVAARGSGSVTVAVLDSGVDSQHREFTGGSVFKGANYVGGGTDVHDDFPGGHGTGVVGLLAANPDNAELAGLLPGFDVTVHKVADLDGFCTLDAVVLGILGALNGNADDDLGTAEIPEADVLCCPLSFSGQYRTLERVLAEADARGVVVVAAAGNNGRSAEAREPRYPAGYSTVIGVGATDIEGEAAPFSNRADALDMAAPGVDLLVPIPGNRYGFADGTSYAAAQGAAAAAWLLDREGDLTPAGVRDRLNQRGDPLSSGHGFSTTTATRLNLLSALEDRDEPVEPYFIRDDMLVQATGVDRGTLVSNQAGRSAGGAVAEAFTDETLFWYGYFPEGDLHFELLDGEQRHDVEADSVVPSSIDLFLEFLRGIPLGEVTRLFSVMQQATLIMPDLGGDRRAVEIVAISDGVQSDPRTIIYNPLQRGFNIIAYKNFGSSAWQLRDEEGPDFDPRAANIALLGNGPRPEINWTGASGANRVQLGSSLDPDFLALAEGNENDLRPPLRLGACVGAEVPEQICGTDIELPAGEIARIVVRVEEPGGAQFATLDVIYVP